ncbi:MAG: NAD(P)/FAD-dependent oxidoreductase [Rhodocyclales bacterium]|nr:NAD(P)/FAD-dependent oxidoreductase [Rhodocyclales bacterium]
MHATRRRLLAATAALGTAALLPGPLRAAPALLPPAKRGRVAIVGGGWGGLAAARRLRELAPELEVVLLERNDAFWSLPLTNRWLADRLDGRLLRHDYAAAARAFGYTVLRSEVTAVDRERRELRTADGALAYDWLILAVGIRDDYRAWFGDDARPAAEARQQFGSAWQAGEQQALKARLERFAGGDFVITVPPMPYRCPPAPFERACMIATLFRQKNLKARVIVLDPNPMMQGFARVFGGQYRDRVVYVPQARVQAIDPFAKTVSTDFETFRFDDALLMPPQQAGGLAWQAGLIGRDVNDAAKASGWAALDPLTQRSLADPRVFVVGDMVDRASQLFGHYPKTGQMAARQGQIAAAQIAAEAQGKEAPRRLPDSTCYVLAGAEPMEMMRIETRYRVRGDGLIMQMVQQHYDAQPRDEDVAWAKGMFAELLGPAAAG